MSRLPKRIFYSLLIVLLWFGFVVDGAHALFSSSASLSDSGITSGTANLLINTSQTTVPGVFAASAPGFDDPFVPGQEQDHYLYLKNDASPGVTFDIYLSASNGTNNQQWESLVNIGICTVDINGVVSTQCYEGELNGLTNIVPLNVSLPAGGIQRFLLKTSLDASWSNQGSTFNYGLLFSGIQHIN